MRRVIQIIGLLTALEGILFASFPRGFSKSLRTDSLGTPYLRLVSALNALPDSAIRRMGIAQILAGITAALLAGRSTGKVAIKEEEMEIKEKISRERSIQLLRELADSIEASRELQTTIQGTTVNIDPTGEMEVEYEADGTGGELELEIKWKSA